MTQQTHLKISRGLTSRCVPSAARQVRTLLMLSREWDIVVGVSVNRSRASDTAVSLFVSSSTVSSISTVPEREKFKDTVQGLSRQFYLLQGLQRVLVVETEDERRSSDCKQFTKEHSLR